MTAMPPRKGQSDRIESVLQNILDRIEKLENAVSGRALPAPYAWRQTTAGLIVQNEDTGAESGVIL